MTCIRPLAIALLVLVLALGACDAGSGAPDDPTPVAGKGDGAGTVSYDLQWLSYTDRAHATIRLWGDGMAAISGLVAANESLESDYDLERDQYWYYAHETIWCDAEDSGVVTACEVKVDGRHTDLVAIDDDTIVLTVPGDFSLSEDRAEEMPGFVIFSLLAGASDGADAMVDGSAAGPRFRYTYENVTCEDATADPDVDWIYRCTIASDRAVDLAEETAGHFSF